MTIKELMEFGRHRLKGCGLRQPGADADLLLCTILNCERAYLLAHDGDAVPSDRVAAYRSALDSRRLGVPMQYIRGVQEFWGREFLVTPDVLIPRPETELLVEQALARTNRQRTMESSRSVLIGDIATGSGCVAISLALEMPGAQVVATDISAKALDVARRNAVKHGVTERVEFFKGDLAEPLLLRFGGGVFDVVTCNPPYGSLLRSDIFEKEVLEFEPHVALFGGPQGTEVTGRLVPQARELLKPGGLLLLEIGIGQEEEVGSLLGEGWDARECLADLQGIPRCYVARRSSPGEREAAG